MLWRVTPTVGGGQAVAALDRGPEPVDPPATPPIPPLNVTALVVTKADLVAALRLYVPQLVDIAPLDAERFILGLTVVPQASNG